MSKYKLNIQIYGQISMFDNYEIVLPDEELPVFVSDLFNKIREEEEPGMFNKKEDLRREYPFYATLISDKTKIEVSNENNELVLIMES